MVVGQVDVLELVEGSETLIHSHQVVVRQVKSYQVWQLGNFPLPTESISYL